MSAELRVAVITPYYREPPDILRACIDSVANQTRRCTHFLIADGHPQTLATECGAEHVVLPKSHQDNGNTARAVGSMLAVGEGYDAIAYLDADNWFYPNHIEVMLAAQKDQKADVCTATRSIHRPDGSQMLVDRGHSDGKNHADTSCLFITRPAFRVLSVWAIMPRALAPICDRIMFASIKAQPFRRVHCVQPTVAFRTQYAFHYGLVGEKPPDGAKSNDEITRSTNDWWFSLSAAEQAYWTDLLAFRPTTNNAV